jgi:2,4-dienoyl-CoA reductase (NADPH2)
MHDMLKSFLKFFASRQMERLSKIWMPIGKSVVILGGTLHGFQLAELLTKRGRTVTVVHNGPEKELGNGMTTDDLHYLLAWFKQNHVSVWDNAVYKEITPEGLKIAQHGRLAYVLKGKNVIDTQDLIPNKKVIDQLSGLVAETHVIGSCKKPGLIVDAMQDGHKIGLVL